MTELEKACEKSAWETTWKEILENPDGSINKEQLKKELQDFSDLIDRHSEVVCYLTQNRMSYVTYDPKAIISLVEELQKEEIDEAVSDAQKPEHTKLTDEVKGLIKEVTVQIGKIDQWAKDNSLVASGLEVPLSRIEQALKPFEKEPNEKDI